MRLLSALHKNWFMGHLGRVTYTVHLISAHTSQREIKEITFKLKEQLRSYVPSNLYTVGCNKMCEIIDVCAIKIQRSTRVF